MHPAGSAFLLAELASAADKVVVLVVEILEVAGCRKLDTVAVPSAAEVDATAGSRSCWETVCTPRSAAEGRNTAAADKAEEDVAAAAAGIVAS